MVEMVVSPMNKYLIGIISSYFFITNFEWFHSHVQDVYRFLCWQLFGVIPSAEVSAILTIGLAVAYLYVLVKRIL
jgi:hypothetical protein